MSDLSNIYVTENDADVDLVLRPSQSSLLVKQLLYVQMASEQWYGQVSEQSSQQSTTMPWQPPTPVQHPWTGGSTSQAGKAANHNKASGRLVPHTIPTSCMTPNSAHLLGQVCRWLTL